MLGQQDMCSIHLQSGTFTLPLFRLHLQLHLTLEWEQNGPFLGPSRYFGGFAIFHDTSIVLL